MKTLDEEYGHLWAPLRKADGPLAACWRKRRGFVRLLRMYRSRRDELDTGMGEIEAEMALERWIIEVIAEHAAHIQKQCRHDHRELDDTGAEDWTPSPPPLPSDRKAVVGAASRERARTTRRPVHPVAVVDARLDRMGGWRDRVAGAGSVEGVG